VLKCTWQLWMIQPTTQKNLYYLCLPRISGITFMESAWNAWRNGFSLSQ
jgi:hypothetical protein